MKVAITGANGQLGSDVVKAFVAAGHEVVGLTHADIEVADLDSVMGCLRAIRPAVVVNTAAMHHVENCERQPEQAFAVNAMGARNLATAAQELHAVLMHVSTDYVFDGEAGIPYEERDLPRPLSVYGNSKLAGEYFVSTMLERYYVLRTSAIYGTNPCRAKGRNFIELMLKLASERSELHVVDDEFVTPTATAELAEQMVVLSSSDCYGLYHATSEGSCSWFEFAQAIFAATGTRVTLKPAAPGEFPAKVPRPKYSVLENRGLKEQGINVFRTWQEGLAQYLQATRVPQ